MQTDILANIWKTVPRSCLIEVPLDGLEQSCTTGKFTGAFIETLQSMLFTYLD